MNMNRRKLFGLLAAAPIGTAMLVTRAGAVTEPGTLLASAALPPLPLGYIMDDVHYEPMDWRAAASPAVAVVRRKIYDGEKFVDFDGHEGAAVMNRVMAELRAAK